MAEKDGTTRVKSTEEIENTLVYSYALFITAVTMVVPTRAPMVLAITGGDAAATARTMGLMSSCAAVLELFLNPVFGRLSDKLGRKPFLLLAPLLDSFLHIFVGLFPRSLSINFVDRVITGSMIFCFRSPVYAALADLYGTGDALTTRAARAGKFFGVGAALGPFIGAKLGGPRSFLVSAVAFLFAAGWIWQEFPETLPSDKRRPFDLAACSPLRFLKLFRDRTMAMLATTIGLQSFGDYINIYDINFLYLKTVLGYGQEQVGTYAMVSGMAQIVNGEFMYRLSKQAGPAVTTVVSNAMWTLAMVLTGTAKSTSQLALALLCMCLGYQRAVPVETALQRRGQQVGGMGTAEIEAAKANFTAVLKVFAPILYGNLFAWATSQGRNIPGLPYFFIACVTALSQGVFSNVPR